MDVMRIGTPTGLHRSDDGAGIGPVARPSALRGLEVGVLDNGKPNAAEALAGVASALADRYGTRHVATTKSVSSRACPDEILNRLSGLDAAVVGVGD